MIDHAQVQAMHTTGIPQVEIARRLRCSDRQVRRVLKCACDAPLRVRVLLNSEFECLLWAALYDRLKNYNKVAWHFGVTRQAVFEKLSQ